MFTNKIYLMNTQLTEQSNANAAEVTTLPSENKDKPVVCENCNEQVLGMYCSQCGQSTESTLKYFWTVILHLLDDFFSFDSRANRTLFPLLFRPGFLTKEYISGKRVHYVPPLRLYLFISIVFFISLKYFINTEDGSNKNTTEEKAIAVAQLDKQLDEIDQLITESPENVAAPLKKTKDMLETHRSNIQSPDTPEAGSDGLITSTSNPQVNSKKANDKQLSIGNNPDGSLTFPFLSSAENQKLGVIVDELEAKADKAIKEDPTKLIEAVIGKMPQIMFVLLPLFAALLKIMYVFSKRLYLEHLTVALHSHSFIFFTILLIEILGFGSKLSTEKGFSALESILTILQVLLMVWIPVYLYIMQKRIYQQGYILSTLKYAVVGLIYTVMIGLAGVIAIVWGAVSL